MLRGEDSQLEGCEPADRLQRSCRVCCTFIHAQDGMHWWHRAQCDMKLPTVTGYSSVTYLYTQLIKRRLACMAYARPMHLHIAGLGLLQQALTPDNMVTSTQLQGAEI